MILKMEAADLGFRFEWHPEHRAVYAVHFGSGKTHEQIAGGILSPNAAQLAATMWCRGYRSKAREIGKPRGLNHHQMLCEMGKVGADMPAPTTTPLETPWQDKVEA